MPPEVAADGVRLQKLIAAAGVASRRAAEALMRELKDALDGVALAGI